MNIQNKDLYKLLTDKDKLVNEGREISKQIDDLEKERNKLAMQIQKLKDKVIPIVQKEMEGKLNEYEEISEVKSTEVEGEVEISTYDQVEQFKEFLKEKKAESKPEETTEPDENPVSES